jgi:5-methylcytosine-specific restriction endonuclease McrA
MLTPEALEKQRKYMREYTRKRYREDPEYRARVKASVKRSRERARVRIYGTLINNCQACNVRRRKRPNGRTNIELHHLSKDSYGQETPENTAILCFKCHNVANHLERYFGYIEKETLLEIIRKIREVDPVRNIEEKALVILNRP